MIFKDIIILTKEDAENILKALLFGRCKETMRWQIEIGAFDAIQRLKDDFERLEVDE